MNRHFRLIFLLFLFYTCFLNSLRIFLKAKKVLCYYVTQYITVCVTEQLNCNAKFQDISDMPNLTLCPLCVGLTILDSVEYTVLKSPKYGHYTRKKNFSTVPTKGLFSKSEQFCSFLGICSYLQCFGVLLFLVVSMTTGKLRVAAISLSFY